jgi:hypothetical protein
MISARGPDSSSADEPGIDVKAPASRRSPDSQTAPPVSASLGGGEQPRYRSPRRPAKTAPVARSERRGRSGSHSAVHNGPFTMDVVFELNNHELLITDYGLDKIAD